MLAGWRNALAQARRDLVEAWRERALAAEKREAELAAQLRMVMEERFYRPVVTGDKTEPAAPSEVLPLAVLGGEDYPDEDAIRKEFDAIVAEHMEEKGNA